MAGKMSDAQYTANVNRMRGMSPSSASGRRLRRAVEGEERRRERAGEALPRVNRF